jgi:hypothetical protein
MKQFNPACLIVSIVLLLPFDVVALSDFASTSKLNLSLDMPKEYENSAQSGSYLNPSWVGEVPEWHYYDVFGNQVVNGFYLFNMSLAGDSKANNEESNIALSPILKKWLNGMVQVGDMAEDRGILAMVGDRVATKFTPFTFNQSLLNGVRIDGFLDILYGINSISLISSRISNTGRYGMFMEQHIIEPGSDWLHGLHFNKNIKDIADVGTTWLVMRNQVNGKSGSMSGNLNELYPNTVSALKVYGVNGQCNLPNIKAYGEWAQSQDIIDGSFKPEPGNIGMLNAKWSVFDKLNLGGEGYLVQAKYNTTFYDPAFPNGDGTSQRYLYSLVEDNDDRDLFPENGQEGKINFLPLGGGDMDGVLPVEYDKDKNNRYDWEEDFLNYDCDPPKSDLYFDRNNNGIPEEIEDDPYPDYPYVPSYYLSGERYIRKDDRTGAMIDDIVKDSTWSSFNMNRQVSKGLSGFHLYGSYEIIPKLELVLGGLYEKSEKSSFQMTYLNGTQVGYKFSSESALNLYSVIKYQHDFAPDKKLTLKNYFRMVKDNIPNHTVVSRGGINTVSYANEMLFSTVVDKLDYRDALVEMLVAQYEIYKNRGFNLTSRGKVELTKCTADPEFNYAGNTITSLMLVNKCQYIWLIPVLKDMFLTPKFKNIFELSDYDSVKDSLMDLKYKRTTMSNNAYLMYDWKFTPKTTFTTGFQFELYNDLLTASENFYHGNWTLQIMIKDRYAGLNMILTTGIAKYSYTYYDSPDKVHNALNNPYRVTKDISSYDLFFKIHCGF